MNLALIESREQLNALCQHGVDFNQVECWIYDSEIVLEAKRLGFAVRILKEDDLREEFSEINVWARGHALSWFNDAYLKDVFTFRGVNLLDATSHFAGCSLAWLVGCYRMIDLRFSTNMSSKIFLFKSSSGVSFNSVLALVAQARGISTEVVASPARSKKKRSFPLKESLRKILGSIFQIIAKVQPTPKKGFVFCGGLRHLAPLILEHKSRQSFIFLGELFQIEQFCFCFKKHVGYSLFSEWLTRNQKKEVSVALREIDEVCGSIADYMKRKRIFVYRDFKMEGMENLLLEGLRQYFPHCMHDILAAESIARRICPRAVIFDDDTSNLRAFALSLRHCDILSFVIAHGEVALPYALPANSDTVSIGPMFVNSSYSKAKYASVGWNDSLLIASGLPRYDRISKMIRVQPVPRIAASRKVLYCPHYLSLNSIGTQRPFGGSLRAGDLATVLANDAVLDAVANVQCDLWIKFYRDEVEAWQKYLATRSLGRVQCFHHSEDIFNLINQCDVLISGEFSTVILEGLMFNKPVISLNFSGLPDIHPYAQEGLVKGVYRSEDLPDALRSCFYDAKYLETLRQKRQQQMAFYWSGCDGKSTDRVWQRIHAQTESRS